MNRLRGLKKRIKGMKVCIIEPSLPSVSSFDFKLDSKVRQEIIEATRQQTAQAITEGNFHVE
jgi:hypothetical protein